MALHADLAPSTPETQSPPRTAARGDIQGMRAVAVLLVMLSHAAIPGFGGGYVGVDVFFVISGFLITGILVREVRRTGRVSILDFYARRARRILPAASVVLVAITVASWLAFSYIRASQVLHNVVWAALFGSNIDSARSGSDYFATDSFLSPVQHFWSLAVEEQFYLLWPALIGVIVLVGRRRDNRHIAIALGVVCALSLAWSVHQTAALPESAYFSTFTRAWELGAGSLLALVAGRVHQVRRPVLAFASWLGLGMIAVATLRFDGATAFPGTAALLPVVGAVLVLAGGIRPTPGGASFLLDRPPMRWVGDISYSLYLWHWPFLVIPAMSVGHDLRLRQNLLLLLGAVVVSAITYRYVETPFRKASLFHRSRLKAIALWPTAVAVVLAGVFVVGAQLPDMGATAAVRLDPEQGGGATQSVKAVRHAAARAKEQDPIPETLTPSPLDLASDNWHLPSGCWANTEMVKHDVCNLGDPNGSRTMVLFGDSHMGMWTDPIVTTAKKKGWRVIPFIKTGCPPADITMWRIQRHDAYTECDEYRRWAYREIAKLKPERIVMTGYTKQPFTDPDSGRRMDSDDMADAMQDGLQSSLAKLTAITPKVWVIGDTNFLTKYPADCLGKRDSTLATCARQINPLTQERNRIWQRAAHGADADFVDIKPWLCADDVCPLVIGNVVVYTDQHHLTRTYAATLTTVLADALDL